VDASTPSRQRRQLHESSVAFGQSGVPLEGGSVSTADPQRRQLHESSVTVGQQLGLPPGGVGAERRGQQQQQQQLSHVGPVGSPRRCVYHIYILYGCMIRTEDSTGRAVGGSQSPAILFSLIAIDSASSFFGDVSFRSERAVHPHRDGLHDSSDARAAIHGQPPKQA
jgi:hypothetical protein